MQQKETAIDLKVRFTRPGSTTLCCPHSLSEEGGMALGAQAGESRMADVFRRAGFGTFRRATENPFNIVYEARL